MKIGGLIESFILFVVKCPYCSKLIEFKTADNKYSIMNDSTWKCKKCKKMFGNPIWPKDDKDYWESFSEYTLKGKEIELQDYAKNS